MSQPGTGAVSDLVRSIEPCDALAGEHQRWAMAWLAGTEDIYRRIKPRTPDPHLVSYFLLLDREADSVLLCGHRLSGLWLPTGGHVEPGEDPVETVRREAGEELGITAEFDGRYGRRPFLLTVTETVGSDARHTDVSLWFAFTGRVGQQLRPDPREFAAVRWWSTAELRTVHPDRFEPHIQRALTTLGMGSTLS